MRELSGYRYVILAGCGILIFSILYVLSGRSFLNVSAQNERINLLQSGWNYMPGVLVRSDGLHVSHLGRAIVQQDGSIGQDNSPVNTYGTHLQASGDFSLHATVKDIKGSAVIRLYESVPIVQDEFRVEPRSLEIKLTNEIATVSTWNSYAHQNLSRQSPAWVKSYSTGRINDAALTISRHSDRVSIDLNGKRLTVLPQSSMLKDHVWFGLSAEHSGDSWILSKLEVDAPADTVAINTQELATHDRSNKGIQSLANNKRPGFLVGAAAAFGPAIEDKAYAGVLFGGDFGQITTENALKWQFTHPQASVYDFKEADALVDIARKNKLLVHGHTLVFGEANPTWVKELRGSTPADKDRVERVMIDHIRQTVSHFKGKIASWDVINEPLADYDTPAGVGGLRKHIWYEAMGEKYIASALAAARQADPQAKLYINEFGLEGDGDRWATFLALVKKLKSQNVPIDGVGFQAHVYDADDEIDPVVLRSHIRELAELGLVSRISEMDVHSEGGIAAQAKQYAAVFDVCFSEPSCVSWSTWGVTDRYNLWQDENGRLQQGRDFLWDEQYQPTAGLSAIREMIVR